MEENKDATETFMEDSNGNSGIATTTDTNTPQNNTSENKKSSKKWIYIILGCGCLSVPILMILIFGLAVFSSINPTEQVAKAKDVSNQEVVSKLLNATERYYMTNENYPWVGSNAVPPMVGYQPQSIKDATWLTKLQKDGYLSQQEVEALQNGDFYVWRFKASSPDGKSAVFVKYCYVPQSSTVKQISNVSKDGYYITRNGHYYCLPDETMMQDLKEVK